MGRLLTGRPFFMVLYIFISTVLFIYGVHATTRGGMIFDITIIRRRLYRLNDNQGYWDLIDKIFKPLFDCTPCMASIYGTASFFLYIHGPISYYVPYVFCLSGFNYILNKLIK